MKIVLDTNVLLVSISARSKYHWIFKSLLNNSFELSITNEIITEYTEIIAKYFDLKTAINITSAILNLPNVEHTNIYYNWHLIQNDLSDNKFVDCAIASNSDYIITNDKDFEILKNNNFPVIEIKTINEFKLLLNI